MNKISVRNLRDKQVVSSDGVTLGVLNNIVIYVRSGPLMILWSNLTLHLKKGNTNKMVSLSLASAAGPHGT